MLRHQSHNLCSGCTYRTIHVDGSKDLLLLQADMHGLEEAIPHCNLARDKLSMPPCHPARYIPSFMYTPAMS